MTLQRMDTTPARPDALDVPERTRRALLLLALDGASRLQSLAAAGLDVDDLADAERAGTISIDTETLTVRFRHPFLRAALVSRSTSSERRRAHRVLAEAAPDIEQRALHMAEVATEPDEPTALLLERASGVALRRGDPSTASRVLARAARLSATDSNRQRRLARAAFVAISALGEGFNHAHLQELRSLGTGAGSLHTAVATAFAQLDAGGSTAACRVIHSAIERGEHGWDASDGELIDAFGAWLILCWVAGRDEEWESFRRALARLRPAVPEPLLTLSVAFADTVRADASQRERVRTLLLSLGPDTDANCVVRAATAGLFLDLLGLVRPAALRSIETGREVGHSVDSLQATGIVAFDDFRRGRWDEAKRLVAEGLGASTSSRTLPVDGIHCYVGALVTSAEGEYSAAEAWIARLEAVALKLDARGLQRFAHHARTVKAAAACDWESAYANAVAIGPAGSFPRFVPHATLVAYELVEAAVHTGRLAEARAHYDAMVASDLPASSQRLAMLTHAAGGLVRGGGWRESFETALAVPTAPDWPFDHARVLLAFGARLRRERHPTEARAHLHQAEIAFERLGARPWRQRAARELRAAGEPLATPSNTGLTAQEVLVAELAARGLSNKQIGEQLYLSARTVSGHLYRIFPKLGIVSRSGLRDALHSRINGGGPSRPQEVGSSSASAMSISSDHHWGA